MNHKRRRPKNRRAGCLCCKPHKGNGMKHTSKRRQVRRADADAREQMQRAAW